MKIVISWMCVWSLSAGASCRYSLSKGREATIGTWWNVGDKLVLYRAAGATALTLTWNGAATPAALNRFVERVAGEGAHVRVTTPAGAGERVPYREEALVRADVTWLRYDLEGERKIALWGLRGPRMNQGVVFEPEQFEALRPAIRELIDATSQLDDVDEMLGALTRGLPR